ncbi:MAG: hypothetical protein QNJ88_06835 [Acidimicrobiia bacterium]|nr:hypothetical protein [Acidimicrobiia bacterium]
MNRTAFLLQEVEDLPPEVVDELPSDVVQDLKDGVIEKIPEDVLDSLSESARDTLVDQFPDFVPEGFIEAVASNPTLAVVLAIIGVLAVAGFVWGITKAAMKAVVFFALAAVVAWFLFAQQL